MSDKRLVTGIVIGVAVTAAVCYILYLKAENERLAQESNGKLKSLPSPVKKSPVKKKPVIINLDKVPETIRKDFSEIAAHTHIEKSRLTLAQSLERIMYLKKCIEDRDGYRYFYKNGELVTKENDIQFLYDLTWYKTECDVNREVNNGGGPVDFKVSMGLDQTLVEFKLASNTKLRNNLQLQVDRYAKANNDPEKIVAIVFFTEKQENRVKKLLNELCLLNKKHIVLIDARNDNKISASNLTVDNEFLNEISTQSKAV